MPPGEGDSNDGLPVELFTQFIEIWNGLLDRKDTVYPGLELDDDDEIVKTVSMVRRSDTGMSTLILTHKRCIPDLGFDFWTVSIHVSRWAAPPPPRTRRARCSP